MRRLTQRPVLNAAGSPTFTAVAEDSTNPAGDSVSALIASGGAGYITDVDAGAVQGIAVTASTPPTAPGSTRPTAAANWTAVRAPSRPARPACSPSNATTRDPLRAQRRLQRRGHRITFRAWDQTERHQRHHREHRHQRRHDRLQHGHRHRVDHGHRGQRRAGAEHRRQPDLDRGRRGRAPTRPATASRALIASGGAGITDVDAGAVKGIAITAVDTTNGTWQYSTDGGTNWTPLGAVRPAAPRAARARAPTRRSASCPTPTSTARSPRITFRAWDQTSGTIGGTPTPPPTAARPPSAPPPTPRPSLSPRSTTPRCSTPARDLRPPSPRTQPPRATGSGTLIASAGRRSITDVDAGAVKGIAVTAADTTNGTWQYSHQRRHELDRRSARSAATRACWPPTPTRVCASCRTPTSTAPSPTASRSAPGTRRAARAAAPPTRPSTAGRPRSVRRHRQQQSITVTLGQRRAGRRRQHGHDAEDTAVHLRGRRLRLHRSQRRAGDACWR